MTLRWDPAAEPKSWTVNATGTRTEIIISGRYGTTHAPRKFDGRYIRRLGWRVTLCGQLAERDWSQRRRYGYITCRSCIAMIERRGWSFGEVIAVTTTS